MPPKLDTESLLDKHRPLEFNVNAPCSDFFDTPDSYPCHPDRLPSRRQIHDNIEFIVKAEHLSHWPKSFRQFKFINERPEDQNMESHVVFMLFEVLLNAVLNPLMGSGIIIGKKPKKKNTRKRTGEDMEEVEEEDEVRFDMQFVDESGEKKVFRNKVELYIEKLCSRGPELDESRNVVDDSEMTLNELLSLDNFVGARFIFVALDPEFRFENAVKAYFSNATEKIMRMKQRFRKVELDEDSVSNEHRELTGFMNTFVHVNNSSVMKMLLASFYLKDGNLFQSFEPNSFYATDEEKVTKPLKDFELKKKVLMGVEDLWHEQCKPVINAAGMNFALPQLVWRATPKTMRKLPQTVFPWVSTMQYSRENMEVDLPISHAGVSIDSDEFRSRLYNSVIPRKSLRDRNGIMQTQWEIMRRKVQETVDRLRSEALDDNIRNTPQHMEEFRRVNAYVFEEHLSFIDDDNNSDAAKALTQFWTERMEKGKRHMAFVSDVKFRDLTPWGNRWVRQMAELEAVDGIASSHVTILTTILATLSTWMEWNALKQHVYYHGPPEVGKSKVEEVVFERKVPGTVIKSTNDSNMALFQITDTSIRNSVILMDEATVAMHVDPNKLSPEAKRSVQLLQQAMTSNEFSYRRSEKKSEYSSWGSKQYAAAVHYQVVAASNYVPKDGPLKSRFFVQSSSAWDGRGNRSILAREGFRLTVDPRNSREVIEDSHVMDFLVSQSLMMMSTNALPRPEIRMFFVYAMLIDQKLKSFNVPRFGVREWSRMLSSYVTGVVSRAVYLQFFSEMSPHRHYDEEGNVHFDDFKWGHLKGIIPHLGANKEIALMSLAYLLHTKIPVKSDRIVKQIALTAGKFDVEGIRRELLVRRHNLTCLALEERDVLRQYEVDPTADVLHYEDMPGLRESSYWKYLVGEDKDVSYDEEYFKPFTFCMDEEGKVVPYKNHPMPRFAEGTPFFVGERQFCINETKPGTFPFHRLHDPYEYTPPSFKKIYHYPDGDNGDSQRKRRKTDEAGRRVVITYDPNTITLNGPMSEICEAVSRDFSRVYNSDMSMEAIEHVLKDMEQTKVISVPHIPPIQNLPTSMEQLAELFAPERLRQCHNVLSKPVQFDRDTHGRIERVHILTHILFNDMSIIDRILKTLNHAYTLKQDYLLPIPSSDHPMFLKTVKMKPVPEKQLRIPNVSHIPEFVISFLKYRGKVKKQKDEPFITLDCHEEEYFNQQYWKSLHLEDDPRAKCAHEVDFELMDLYRDERSPFFEKSMELVDSYSNVAEKVIEETKHTVIAPLQRTESTDVRGSHVNQPVFVTTK